MKEIALEEITLKKGYTKKEINDILLKKERLFVPEGIIMDFIGQELWYGTIIAKHLGHNAGRDMMCGKIITNKTEELAGQTMTGGTIIAGEIKGEAGFHMKGGIILVGKTGESTGGRMKGGVIIAGETGEQTRDSARKGTLVANTIGANTAPYMGEGEIFARKIESFDINKPPLYKAKIYVAKVEQEETIRPDSKNIQHVFVNKKFEQPIQEFMKYALKAKQELLELADDIKNIEDIKNLEKHYEKYFGKEILGKGFDPNPAVWHFQTRKIDKPNIMLQKLEEMKREIYAIAEESN